MRSVFERIALAAVLGGVLGMLPLLPASAEITGAVISTTGSAYAEGAGGKRSLGCRAQVREGERILTEAGARLALVAGDVYVQIDRAANLGIGRNAAGAPSIEIASGRVRLIDTRSAGGSPFEIRTPHSQASGLGTDTEVVVSGARTELCEGAADLDVTAREGNASLVARAGQCVTVSSGDSPSTAVKGEATIALAGAEGCIKVAAVNHFTPDVAAPPPTIGLAPIDPDRTFDLCSDPGAGCIEMPTFRDPAIIIEIDPEPICGFACLGEED
jgi:hypothetical protein